MSEKPTSREQELKEAWLKELASFIVEANGKTWAADGAEVEPERPGYKELEYRNGLWRLRDSYTGYFRAPGMTTVYYKDIPAWTMAFGGHGQIEGFEDRARETFNFLRKALRQVSPDLPFRGPELFEEGNKKYTFELLQGDIADALWREEVFEDEKLTFTQTGIAGIVIHRNEARQPIYPWNR